MKCTKCEISEYCKNPAMMGNGKRTARIMFISDNPTEVEDKKGIWMEDKGGNLLTDLLTSMDIDVEVDCYFTGAIKCPTPKDDKGNQRQPLRDEIANCKEYLDAEIAIINPDIIVPMGNVALKAITGKTGITKYRGKAVELHEKGEMAVDSEEGKSRIVFPILHPNAVFKQPRYAKNFTTDLNNLQLLLTEGMSFLESSDVEYRYLEEEDAVMEELERLNDEADMLVFDLETTGLNPYLKGAKIICISLTDKTHYGVTIPLEHKAFVWPPEVLQRILAKLKWLMENKSIKKMGHNGKFDMKWLLYKYGIDVANYAFDPMIAHYIGISEERGGHGLKDLAWEHTDMGGYDNALDEYKKEHGIVGNYEDIAWEILREYAAADVDCTMRLYKKFKPIIDNHDKWPELFDMYMEASYALRDMENDGIKLNTSRLKEFDAAYKKRIEEIEARLRSYPEVVQIEREKHKMFERRQLEMKKPKDERDPEILKWNKFKNFEFSFGSVNNLRELLFERLGLDTPFKTPKGELSTGKETLAYLEDKHPLPKLLSEWRKLEKLYGTYIAPAESWIGEDGLVHPTFNLVGTVTSRLASEQPNAQNFPRKSNTPSEFQYRYGPKKLFVSRFGDEGVMLQFDYSQLELRVAAIFSNDPGLIGAYKAGKDLHIYVASKVYKVPESEVSDDQRTAAKAVGFGLLYGKGARSLAQDMGVDLEEAEQFIATYFREFAGMKTWIDNTKKQVMKEKYVETLAGFRRRLSAIDSNERGIQADAMRQSINAPIQGSGSSMTLKSIILINKMFKAKKLKSVLAITVHDSIVADVYIPELKTVHTIMKTIMENLPFEWITVPILSDAEIGLNYGDMVGISDIDEVVNHEDGVIAWVEKEVQAKHEKNVAKENEKKNKMTA